MKTLYLLRHAEAEPHHSKLNDFDRELSPIGKVQAFRRGDELSAQWPAKGKVYFSTALRTRQTLELFSSGIIHGMEQWQWLPTQELYNAPKTVYRQLTENTPDHDDYVMLVGHNPGISQAINWFIGDNLLDMQEGDLATIVLPINSWKEIFEGCGKLIGLKS